eukprot:TRINITY_DN147_c0_g1_i13.p1 TRINITY_DN147_c0_g1~~TRINITY_DN147_c0_g1_i13.p1  ORF type:complete len:319 (+),score=92.34 TRINITY_DN147_c0_g1_i13:361-1317(+)
MGSDNFCLRWNDFESNVSSSFRELREEKDLFDVTLVTDSEKEFKAHKVILSACSSFFKGVLRRMGSPSPLIYLRGIGASELAAILDFMYNGEVNVAQEELNSFLSVAEDLRIKGLTQKPSASENSHSLSDEGERKMGAKSKLHSSSSSSPSLSAGAGAAPPSPSSSKKFRRIAPKSDMDGKEHHMDVKSEPTISSIIPDGSVTDYDDGAGSYEDAYGDESAYFDDAGMMGLDDVPPDSQDNSKGKVMKLSGNRGKCLICGRVFSNFNNARRHYDTTHNLHVQPEICDICFCSYKNKESVSAHKRKAHKIYKSRIPYVD